MLKSNRGNRLSNGWRCPHCGTQIDVRTFRLDPTDSAKLVYAKTACNRSFAWKSQNKGKL